MLVLFGAAVIQNTRSRICGVTTLCLGSAVAGLWMRICRCSVGSAIMIRAGREGFKCVLCGRSMADGIKQLEVDHIRPVSKGGLTEPGNLRTLCWDCNQGKKDRYIEGGMN